MIEKLKILTESLIVVIAITTLIEMILPESNNNKYIKIICSIYILFTIISPLLNMINYNPNELEKSFSSNTIQASTLPEKDLADIYLNAYEEEIKNRLISEGFQIRKIKINANSDLEDINNIEIDTYYISEKEKNNIQAEIKMEYGIQNVIIR